MRNLLFGGSATVAALNLVGLLLPSDTTCSAETIVDARPEKIFLVLSDIEALPAWKQNARAIQGPAPLHQQQTAIQTSAGTVIVVLIASRTKRPFRVVTASASTKSGYSAIWTYDLSPIGNRAALVTLTEQAHSLNPLLRVLLRIFNPANRLEQDLEDVRRKFSVPDRSVSLPHVNQVAAVQTYPNENDA